MQNECESFSNIVLRTTISGRGKKKQFGRICPCVNRGEIPTPAPESLSLSRHQESRAREEIYGVFGV